MVEVTVIYVLLITGEYFPFLPEERRMDAHKC